jgi:hypothetical protein
MPRAAGGEVLDDIWFRERQAIEVNDIQIGAFTLSLSKNGI